MSDVIFYACGHAIAQRDITDTFTISLGSSDESSELCPNCKAGKFDEKYLTKDMILHKISRIRVSGKSA